MKEKYSYYYVKLWITGESYRCWKGNKAAKIGRGVIQCVTYAADGTVEALEKAKQYTGDLLEIYAWETKNPDNVNDFVWQVKDKYGPDEDWFIGKDTTYLPNGRPWTPRKPWIRKKVVDKTKSV